MTTGRARRSLPPSRGGRDDGATKTFPIFDCDSHIVEPPQIWDEYVPAAVRTWAKTQFHFLMTGWLEKFPRV